jgi:hypothetical protein
MLDEHLATDFLAIIVMFKRATRSHEGIREVVWRAHH